MRVLIAVEDDLFGLAQASYVTNTPWPPLTEFKVVHVIEPVSLKQIASGSILPLFDFVEEELHREAAAMVRRVALRIRDKFKSPYVFEEVVKGRAKEKIVEAAEQWSADLIIIGSHGRRGVDLLMLGSVSNAVSAHAPCSVIVVKLPATGSGSTSEPAVTQSRNEASFRS